jgi:hypothetical protein
MARRTRELLYAVAICCLSGCAGQQPPVECAGKIVLKISSDTCDARLWQIPLEVRLGGQVVGSIDPEVKEFTGISWSSRSRDPDRILEVWIGKRQLGFPERLPRCEPGTPEQKIDLTGFHGAVYANKPVSLPCEGTECFHGEPLIVQQGSRCHSEFTLRLVP